MKTLVTQQELHNMAMNVVGEGLKKRGWEFLAVNSALKKNPQFVCVDANKQKHFVIVRAVKYPDSPKKYDVIFMESIKQHALQFNAKVYYAGVGLANHTNYEIPLYKEDKYIINYNDLIEI